MEDFKKHGNHKTYAHRGDDFGLSADQAEAKLRSKLRENFSVSKVCRLLERLRKNWLPATATFPHNKCNGNMYVM